jgi:hypothetical protein
MLRKSVDSSMISSIGYDASSQTLEVQFKTTGAVWQYDGVSEATYKELIGSESVGKAFNRIRGNYSESKV